ncbi:MAG: ABC transporter permease [Saprospiraceae bacterium]|nr:ABC transporter permease [Saprospiraceae bacterium]
MVDDDLRYHDPPPRMMRILRWFCADIYLEEVEGDLYELFQEEVEEHGLKKARRRFFFTAIRYLKPFFFGKKDFTLQLEYHLTMLKHYLKIAFRQLRKQQAYSFINISGLAIAMACCIVVLVFVHDETSFDAYHPKAEDIYRLSIRSLEVGDQNDESLIAASPILWGPALKKDYPEVENFTRFVPRTSPDNPWDVTVGDRSFSEARILYTDPATLDMFNWPIINGDVSTALSDPNTIVITEAMAEKYFRGEDPIGKVLTIDPKERDREGNLNGNTYEFTISAVMANVPERSHFRFDFLLPSSILNDVYGGDINGEADINPWYWRGLIGYTYLELKPGTDVDAFAAKFEAFQERYVGDATRSRGYYYEPDLQRLDQIYLDGERLGQMRSVGDKTYIYVFSLVALFILFLACINFMNLATARSAMRAKEVGLRKVVGAFRKQLVSQFLGESVVISLLAFSVAAVLAWLVLPIFYEYLGKELFIDYSREAPFLASLLILGVLVGILAGSYPAFFLSRFRPALVLKGVYGKKQKGALLRKGLVVFQFMISAFFIIMTITLFKQIRFMRNYDLGFDQERVVVLPPNVAQSLSSQYETVRGELLADPRFLDVTMSSEVPGQQGRGGDLYVEKGADIESSFSLDETFVDYNFIDLFGLQMLAGEEFKQRNIEEENAEEQEVVAILNEAAVRQFGWANPEEAIGKQIVRDPNAKDWVARVIGVVKDFHSESLREEIGPKALIQMPRYGFMSIKLKTGDLQGGITSIQSTVEKFVKDVPFEYNFLDATFKEQYETEAQLSSVFTYISILAIFIACLGLFGLATFTTARRIKEVGIRKTLGASVQDIVILLSKNFAFLILVAGLVAAPFAYLAAEKGLQYFAYSINNSMDTYILAILGALIIALITIAFQTIRAALSNPVESLRTE